MAKDDKLRLIIDAQNANRRFKKPNDPDLPYQEIMLVLLRGRRTLLIFPSQTWTIFIIA